MNWLMLIPFLVLIPLCAFLNRMRGTEAWCAHLYGGIIAGLLAGLLKEWWMLAFYPLFLFGECFGWGDMICELIANENREQNRMLLSVRGAWWWAGCFGLFLFFGVPAGAVLLCIYSVAIAFPLSIQAAMKLTEKGKDPWMLAEWIYGAVQGLALAVCFVLVK